MSYYKDVRDWHSHIGQERKKPNPEFLKFREKLDKEEYKELLEALEEGNIEHIVKETADLVFVLLGRIAQWDHNGAEIDFDEVWRRVVESNRSKKAPSGRVEFNEFGKAVKGSWYKPPKFDDLF